MKIARTLAVLAAAATAAGFTHARTAQAGAGSAVGISIGYCTYDYCRAEASGGSGGYSYSWHNAVNIYESGNVTMGDPNCGHYPGYISVGVTVTDGTGASATAYKEVRCPGDDIPTY